MPNPRSHASNGSGSASATSRPRAFLEIVPDTRFIVFHGTEHEAAPVLLRGIVRLTTPESMSILRPRVRLEGKRKVGWWYMTGLGAGEVVDKRVFWNAEQRLGGIETAHKIKAGVIEWPFEFELSPAMPESVEGLRDTYIAYHIHATVSRPGWNAKDLVAQEHIRLVRTLGPDSLGMTRSRINSDIWANKISYSISIPTDAVVFGTSLTADVELSPLRKGVRLGKVELRLMETIVKRIQASEVPDARGDRIKTDELEVAKEELDFPEHARVVFEDETADSPVMADEMYKFKATLPLPKSLNLCRQDVDSHQVNITHRFKLMVNIHNPEGHVSQLVCRLPVKLFISPSLPVDESNHVQHGANGVSDEALNSRETAVVAPPQYGRHQLDQIFSDVDTAGYLSRAGSASATPAGLGAQSRRTSHENLASLNSLASGLASSSLSSIASSDHLHGSATPSILRSRLAALQERGSSHSARAPQSVAFALSNSGGNSPHTEREAGPDDSGPGGASSIARSSGSTPGGYFPHSGSAGSPAAHSAQSSAPLSRRTSDDLLGASYASSAPAVHRADYDMSDLSRVPSYGAALRAPGPVTPFSENPPSYVEATSRPASPAPGSLPSSPPSGLLLNPLASLQRPVRAHFRPPGAATAAGPAPESGAAAADADADARLRMLRAQT